MALLFLFSKLRRRFALKLFVAHVSHGLNRRRDEQAESVVRSAAARLELPYYGRRIDVRRLARLSRRSVEEVGRDERYRFFAQVAARVGATHIATAHTLDDQAETVLFRLLRGSGLKGLAGIPHKRLDAGYTLIRPLLFAHKKDILRLAREERIPYVIDASNTDRAFTRNRIRHDLLPLLEKRYNRRIKETLLGLQHLADEAHDLIERQAVERLKRWRVPVRGLRKLRLSNERLRALHPALFGEVLRQLYSRAAGDMKRLGREHVHAVSELVRSSVDRAELSLPKGIRVIRKGPHLQIRKGR